ncbi:MAG: DUF2971 domain-containing protein [Candidatus Marinimicrobia bacterium]|nr:DUF2971 domain-containing protein [Candidatus Neomarinimicrobiota bacterium]
MNDFPKDLLEKIRPYKRDELYKYRVVNKHLEDMLKNQRIYLPSPIKFNDPFDCYPRVKYYRDPDKQYEYFLTELGVEYPNESMIKLAPIAKSMVKNSTWDGRDLRSIIRKMLTRYGVFSLSELNDNLLMWSHYADSHRGVCLIFDTSDDTNIFGQAIKVQYQHEYPVINIMDLNNHNNTINMISVKSIDWGYEKEWRIIRGISVGGDGYFDIEPKSLTGIILGSHITEKDEKRVMGWTSKYPTSLNVFTSKIDSRQYKVNIVPNEGTVVKVK